MEDVPRELVVDAQPAPGDSSDGSGATMAPIVLTVFAAGFLSKFVQPLAGLAALVLGVAFVILRRKPNRGRYVLRVSDATLEVDREKKGDPPVRVPLADLDVTLERKPHAAGGRAAAERVRIALERKGADPLFVPDDPLTPIEAQEWFARVRSFLRKHGWTSPSD